VELRRFGFCVVLVTFGLLGSVSAQPAGDAPRPLTPIAVTDTDYPLPALLAAEQGRVTLNLTIGTDGRVTDAQVARSSGSQALDQAAVRIAEGRWRYQPVMRNGQPVVSTVSTDVVWTLPLRPAAQTYVAAGPRPAQPGAAAVPGDYPALSMARGEQGVVGVRYVVGPDGLVQNAELAAPSGYSGLDNAALRAVRGGRAQPGQQGVRDRLVAFALVPAHAYGAEPRCYAAPVLAHESVLIGGEQEFSHFSGLHGRMIMRWRTRPIHNWTAIWVQASPAGTVSDMLIETKAGWMQVPASLRASLLQERVYRVGAAPANCWYYDPIALLN
jgi:TonB family protein